MKIPVEISARHIHLSKEDFEKLFGKKYKLKILRKISQLGQFAAKETLTLINGNRKIENVRIIGPTRNETQVEISKTDAVYLKIKPPVRVSGDLKNTPGIILKSKKATIKINNGIIISKRHLHISNEEGNKLGLKNNQEISIKVSGERGLIFDNIIVRKGEGNHLSFQIDTDEANAAGISGKMFGELYIK